MIEILGQVVWGVSISLKVYKQIRKIYVKKNRISFSYKCQMLGQNHQKQFKRVQTILLILYLQKLNIMPKRKNQEQDQSYTQSQTNHYRKYAHKTKLKLCLLVKKHGWKLTSAAKLLKVKESTAKMILKNFKHPDLQEAPQIPLENHMEKGKETQEQMKNGQDIEIKQQCHNQVYYWVYWTGNPYICMLPQEEK